MEIINAFNGIFTIVTMIGIGVIVAKKLMNQEYVLFYRDNLTQTTTK